MRIHHFPQEYHSLFKSIQKHSETYHKLPTFEDLRFEVRDASTREKLYAVESVEVDADASMLFQYLKNEYVQGEVLREMDRYITESISFEDAEETIANLHQMAMDLENEAELEHPTESMQTIDLFASDEELGNYLALGLNHEFDSEIRFSPQSLIMFGGFRGSGKSVVCANIVASVLKTEKSAIYFTVEMETREILQRICSISTETHLTRLTHKNLSISEWEDVALWWANRFTNGKEVFDKYTEHRDFSTLHRELTSTCKLKEKSRLDIVHEKELTVAKIRAELDKKLKEGHDVGVVIVDYINVIKRGNKSKGDLYDWTEQVLVSKELKTLAQTYNVPIVAPFQITSAGEVRFAKGILDSADVAWNLNPNEVEDACMDFDCIKVRAGPKRSFSSYVDWDCIKIGPQNGFIASEESSGEETEPPFEID